MIDDAELWLACPHRTLHAHGSLGICSKVGGTSAWVCCRDSAVNVRACQADRRVHLQGRGRMNSISGCLEGREQAAEGVESWKGFGGLKPV